MSLHPVLNIHDNSIRGTSVGSDINHDGIGTGRWLRPFCHDPIAGDVHPNEYGAKVIGKLVYDKIAELGYLND